MTERDQYVYEYELRLTDNVVTSTGRITQTTPVNEGDMIAVASTLTRVERITLGPPDSDAA